MQKADHLSKVKPLAHKNAQTTCAISRKHRGKLMVPADPKARRRQQVREAVRRHRKRIRLLQQANRLSWVCFQHTARNLYDNYASSRPKRLMRKNLNKDLTMVNIFVVVSNLQTTLYVKVFPLASYAVRTRISKSCLNNAGFRTIIYVV